MAIPGVFHWLDSDGANTKFQTYDMNPTTGLPSYKHDYAKAAAERWFGAFQMDGVSAAWNLYDLFATLSQTDLEKLMQPGYYPQITKSGGTVTLTVMAEGKFPNFVNHRGMIRSPAGVLGLPEQNEFGGGDASNKVIPITDPAI